MRITKTYAWSRRDFSATLKCEACHHEQEQRNCYDDAHYHNKVIPDIACDECGQSTNSLGETPEPARLKYAPHETV